MLDDVTKKRINTLRQILVGKLPDPKAQVEQITNGLIYKFMNDMDEQSVSMGGKSTYFSGKFQKYSWKNLLDTKTSGVEKIALYSEALNGMSNNENLPELFRDIFKDSVLPFKDPSTLNMFLKEINEFHYSNSEKLGDAFEYLLSFMGSQGDAGQFRTPRHIIDFIIEIVNPQKNETVLDPACGTAGFLISAYKHILKQNTKKNLGDGLNTSDRKKIGENLNGYDISPDMVKMSLVNMYLHKFTNPKINEYDTLSSEDRWNEYYDVILANPPFFSPKGGIMPHNRFGVSSTKAEVLFIDYINEHLKPNGRAGIIVPEGIIFQTGTAYKQLRKRLIETSLLGVVSLPAGIFNPYSGVKTSIIILDKQKSKVSKSIFYYEIKNDGFDLGSNRKEISKNDLPDALKEIDNFLKGKKNKIVSINKEDLLQNKNFELKPLFEEIEYNSNFEIKEIRNYIKIQSGFAFESKKFNEEIGFPIIRIRNIKKNNTKTKFNGDYNKDYVVNNGCLLVGMDGEFNRCIWTGGEALLNQRVANIKTLNDKLNLKYLYYLIQKPLKDVEKNTFAITVKHISSKQISQIKIPLPSIETQNQIVEELDGYQKVIDGCRLVVENYRPSIDIDSSWEMVDLNDICDVRDGTHDSPKYVNEGYPLITSKNVINGSISFEKVNFINQRDFDDINKRSKVDSGDILMPMIGTIGRPTIVKTKTEFAIKNVALIKTKNKISQEYVRLVLDSKLFENYLKYNQAGSTQKFLSLGAIRKFKVPVPPKNIEKKLIENINEEELIVSKNKDLIANFQSKIKNKIDSIWTN
jgi:type I restriction enzyme M protein